MITGERGIGKTSLHDAIRSMARSYGSKGDQPSFLIVNAVLDTTTTQLELVKKIERALRAELQKTEDGRRFLEQAWEFIQRIVALGVSIKKSKEEANEKLLCEELGLRRTAFCTFETPICRLGP